MKIEYRQVQRKDLKNLQAIVQKTWNYDQFCSQKTARKLAKVFLSSCLTNYTYSQVAILDGNVAGIILVKNKSKYHCPLTNRLRQIFSIISLLLTKEGRKVSKIFQNMNGIDQKLLEEIDYEYPAELALFALHSKYRGIGLGKELFERALSHMRKESIPSFYLFTDTSCNYGFYEHQGMRRCAQRESEFLIDGYKAVMNFFIYDYTL